MPASPKSGPKSKATDKASPQPEPALGINRAKAKRAKAKNEALHGVDKRRKRKRRPYLVKFADPTRHDAWWYLMPRERAFVTALLQPGAANDIEGAARHAGYKDELIGYRLMKKMTVRAALYQKSADLVREGVIDTSQWLREVGRIAFMPGEMLKDRPTAADKLKALELFGKYHKWLVENVNVRGYVGVAHLFGKALAEITQEDRALPAPNGADTEHSVTDSIDRPSPAAA